MRPKTILFHSPTVSWSFCQLLPIVLISWQGFQNYLPEVFLLVGARKCSGTLSAQEWPLVVFRGTICSAGDQTSVGTCKARTSHPVLSLWSLFARIYKIVKWKLTSEVTRLSCVQEESLSHTTGFPLKLVSVMAHFGASSSWTRETTILVNKIKLVC